MANFAKLKGRIVEMGMSRELLADKLGITRMSLNNKLNGKYDFKISEAGKLIEMLGIPSEEVKDYFFCD